MEKFLLINKPAGWTSFDVVGHTRKHYLRGTKVGHAGTLDPFATGLLIVGVGREATRQLDEFKNLPKTYEATIFLGAVSDTQDRTGRISDFKFQISNFGFKILINKIFNISRQLSLEKIEKILKKFIGRQKQIPPMYSAKKIGGKKLYDLARQGIEVKRKANAIEIYNIELLDYGYPRLKIRVKCSAGTYIRTLAHDLGQRLGCGAYCEELERTEIGEYKLSDAKTIEQLNLTE